MQMPIQFGKPVPGATYKERSGAYAVLFDNDGRIGIIRTDRGHFLPGGGIEPTETPEAALVRELIEETGYTVTIRRPLGQAALYDCSPRLGYLHAVGHFFVATLGEHRADKVEADHELVWVAPGEAQGLLHLEHQTWAVGEALRTAAC